MRVIVVGLGVQGYKRRAFAGADFVASVDPVNAEADYRAIEDVPLDRYDAVLACIPDAPKVEILRYCIDNKKHVLVEKPLWAPREDELVDFAGARRAATARSAIRPTTTDSSRITCACAT